MISFKKLLKFQEDEKDKEGNLENTECNYCHKPVVIEKAFYLLDSSKVFCSRNCYLKSIEKEYY